MTAQALLALTDARLFAKPAASEKALAVFKKSRGPPPLDPRQRGEVRRFFVALLWGTARVLIAHVLRWPNWHRHHQALAKLFHYKTRRALAYLHL